MPSAAKKTTPTPAPAAAPEVAPDAYDREGAALQRYHAALVDGKTVDQARAIGWPGSVEDADSDNAMITPTGDRFFPDSPEDAAIFASEHGAAPEHPDRWPWPDEVEPFDPAHCPTPGQCFPLGFAPNTSHAACIHGETHAP